MTRVIAAALFLLAASPAFGADVLVKIKTHSDAIAVGGQSQPARDAVAEQWYGPGKTAQSSGDGGFIVDLGRNMAYMVNHRDKSYVPLPLPIDISKVLPPEIAPMAAGMQMTAAVAPTSETKTIGAWPCSGYDVSLTVMGMAMTMRVWASTAVPAALLEYAEKVTPVFLQGQMRLTDASVKEFAKIKGFHVATELTGDMMGARIRTTTEVIEIIEKPAPAGTFDAPAGYTQKATLTMQDLQRR